MSAGLFAKAGAAISGKTAAVVAAGALVVSGAAGAGVWWAARGPHLAVVQRSASVQVPAGGEQAIVAGCAKHETALGGGYAIDGNGFATTSEFIGAAWLAAAYNPGDAPVTLTSYALCVNAKPEFEPHQDFTPRAAHAFRDRGAKATSGDDGPIHDLSTDGPYAQAFRTAEARPACFGGYTLVGVEFRAARSVTGRPVAPVPLDKLTTDEAADGKPAPGHWTVSVNPGTQLSTGSFPMRDSVAVERKTRILEPQPPQANFAVDLRPICVRLKDVSIATAAVAVGAGATADATVKCPKGRLVLGGGFLFPADNEGGDGPQRFLGDGWLYASADGPTPGSSGRPVKDWHVTGHNQQRAGTPYHNSVWIEHSDAETLTGNGYFDDHGHSADDQLLRGSALPDSQRMVASAVCGTIDAEPTSPDEGTPPPAVTRPELPPSLDLAPSKAGPTPSSSPSPGASPSPSPSPSTSPNPSGSPGVSPTPRTPSTPGPTTGGPNRPPSTQPGRSPSAQPQAPAVSIEQPGGGGKLRRGCEEAFAGTARTRPGDRAITDPQATTWQIIGPNGPVTIGAGASGRFLVPLLADGTYPLVFSATDTAAGLTGSARISIQIVGCLR
ncbi:hypothetical protein ACFTWH_06525 [Streptomyces sp. NPDC057011]|uniref:hypothetical protein n=1 Tax=unclassified Streptomyces TaxID=2593676 RepID=UPI003627E631